MPTYGYRCTACGHEFERMQKMTDAPIKECETCAAPVKKILYPVGISFKGDGFYVNDYAPKSAKNADKAEASPAAEKTDSAKSEAKTEAKTDAPAPAADAAKSVAPSAPAVAAKPAA